MATAPHRTRTYLEPGAHVRKQDRQAKNVKKSGATGQTIVRGRGLAMHKYHLLSLLHQSNMRVFCHDGIIYCNCCLAAVSVCVDMLSTGHFFSLLLLLFQPRYLPFPILKLMGKLYPHTCILFIHELETTFPLVGCRVFWRRAEGGGGVTGV